MDSSIINKRQKKKIKALKKKLKEQEEAIKRQTPEGPKDSLEDVMSNELEGKKLKVNKAPAGEPVSLPEDADKIESEPEDLESAVVEDKDEEEEEEAGDKEDTVTGGEILEAAGESKKPKSKRGGGGDFGHAYQELYTQLCMRMLNRIYRYFTVLYKKSKSEKAFQAKLANIQKWNQMDINRRAKEIVDAYPDTETYFKYTYASNVMLMSVVVQKDEDSEDIEVEVPKFSTFIHKSYIESARAIYDNVGVLNPDLPDKDRLAIRTELYRCYGNAIATALRMMVPLESIAPKLDSSEKFDEVGDSSGEEDSGSEEEEEDSDLSDDGPTDGSDEESSGSEDLSELSDESDLSDLSDSEEEGVKRVKVSKKALRTPDEPHPFD